MSALGYIAAALVIVLGLTRVARAAAGGGLMIALGVALAVGLVAGQRDVAGYRVLGGAAVLGALVGAWLGRRTLGSMTAFLAAGGLAATLTAAAALAEEVDPSLQFTTAAAVAGVCGALSTGLAGAGVFRRLPLAALGGPLSLLPAAIAVGQAWRLVRDSQVDDVAVYLWPFLWASLAGLATGVLIGLALRRRARLVEPVALVMAGVALTALGFMVPTEFLLVIGPVVTAAAARLCYSRESPGALQEHRG